MAVRAARMYSTTSPTTVTSIVEASQVLHAETVQAWLVESAPDMNVNAEQLIRMADAGVASDVIDVVVAVVPPPAFPAAARKTRSGARAIEQRGPGVRDRLSRLRVRTNPWYYSPFGFGYYDGYYGYGYSPYRYGYSPVRLRVRRLRAGVRVQRLLRHRLSPGRGVRSSERVESSSSAEGWSGVSGIRTRQRPRQAAPCVGRHGGGSWSSDGSRSGGSSVGVSSGGGRAGRGSSTGRTARRRGGGS